MALIDDFKVKFSEFDTTYVDTNLPLLETTYTCFYGIEYKKGTSCDDEAILYLLAHLLRLQQNGSGQTTGVASKSVDGVSISYITPSNATERFSFYGSTRYGLMFMQITSKRQGAFFV